MRYVLVALIGVLLIAHSSCLQRSTRKYKRWLTGTCPGACDYYANCKELRGDRISDQVHAACTRECDEIFSSSETILAFESLVCEDAIAFVEGTGGRQPGEAL